MRITHPDYALTIDDIKATRDCVEGAAAIVRETTKYLPHPSQIDKVSKQQKARYDLFLRGAEFDGEPDRLRRSMLGKMRIASSDIDLPTSLEFLESNVDGDGLGLTDAIEYAVNNVIQTKWHLLVVDHKGEKVEGELSIAQAEALKGRPTIKQYTRENVTNWNFSRVDGVMQLSYVELLEKSTTINEGTHITVENYLILALDANGNYYQQKIVMQAGKQQSTSEPDYVSINGKALRWLPVVIIADEQIPNTHLPRQLGYLYGVCDLSLHKYRVSAVYKEVQRNLAPTIMNQGWKDGDIDIFKQSNGQRDYIATGAMAVNNLPEGVTSQILSASADMTDFQWYFNNSAEKAKVFGGQSQSEGAAVTATEAGMISADQNALFETIAECAQKSFKKALAYCGMFAGLWKPEQVEQNLDKIIIELPRDFATPKITVEERAQALAEYIASVIPLSELHRQLEQGGAFVGDIEDINAELEDQPPRVLTTPAPVAQTTKEAVPNE